MGNFVFLAGAPKAGKSYSLSMLKDALCREGITHFVLSLNPDCEGRWTAQSGRYDLAKSTKEILKKRGEFFSPDFIRHKVSEIRRIESNNNFPLILCDLGGVPSAENKLFIDTVQDKIVVILHGKETCKNKTLEWVKFCKENNFKFRVVYNDYSDKTVKKLYNLLDAMKCLHSEDDINIKQKEGNEMLRGYEVKVVSNGGILTVSGLQKLVDMLYDTINEDYAIVGGRMPVWAYGAIVHAMHPKKWVAIYDPRLGAVVVKSHVVDRRLEDIIPDSGIEWKVIEI